MALFETGARFAAPAEAVWDYVSWTGVERLAEGNFFSGVSFEDRTARPGAVRITHLPEAPPIKERLEEIVEADFFYRYRLIDMGPLPITDYLGLVRVTPAGGGCILKLAHEATVVEGSEEAWRAQWLEIEEAVFAFIRTRAEG